MKTAITFLLSSLLGLASHAAIFSSYERTNLIKGADILLLDVANGAAYVTRAIAISNFFKNGIVSANTDGSDTLLLLASSGGFSGGDFRNTSHVTNVASGGFLTASAQSASNLNTRSFSGSHVGAYLPYATNVYTSADYGSFIGLEANHAKDSAIGASWGSHVGLYMDFSSNIVINAETAAMLLEMSSHLGGRSNISISATDSLVVGQPPSNYTNAFTNAMVAISAAAGTYAYVAAPTIGANGKVFSTGSNSVEKASIASNGDATFAGRITTSTVGNYAAGGAWWDFGVSLGNSASLLSTTGSPWVSAGNLGAGGAGIRLRSGNRLGWSTSTTDASASVGSSLDNLGNDTVLVNTNLIAKGSVTATNGIILYQRETIPTNSIPTSSASVTNWVLLNLTNTIASGGPVYVATNISASGSFLVARPSLTVTTYP